MPRLASLLRSLAALGQYGHPRKPDNFYVGDSYCSFHWDSHGRVPDYPTWVRLARLSERYRRYVHYCREVAPRWVEVERVHYADNSIEAIQESRAGERRTVLVDSPHGDVCF